MIDHDLARSLQAPFPASVVRTRPGPVNGTKAMVLQYVDIKTVLDRLDAVLGTDGWQDAYDVLSPFGAPVCLVVCRLRIRVAATWEWIEKTDTGSSTMTDEASRTKAAFSNALKRVAMKFGVARYLAQMPVRWAEIDPRTKRFIKAVATAS